MPGTRVSELARRWQLCSQQVIGWRRPARRNMTATPAFIPMVTKAISTALAAPVIETELAGAVVRVVSSIDDAAQLTAILRAVRASASAR